MAVETQFLPILTRQASSRVRDFGRRPPPRSAPRWCASTRRYKRWRATMWCGFGCPSP